MKKVAIVGVEGSGKTVMLAGLGDLYTYPDEEGYFLAPKNFGTAAYVTEKIERMRKGEWPTATAGDEMQGLDWTLKCKRPGVRGRPEIVCEVSFLDFAGEVYRAAYGISGGGDPTLKEQVDALKQYVLGADDLIVLINLRDVIRNGIGDRRVQEAMWITKSILDTALSDDADKGAPRAAIVLSQADSYASTIDACGGALGVLQKYLPHVANDYDWIDIFAVSAVDRTELDDNGTVVPAADFTAKGLLPIMQWLREEDAEELRQLQNPRQHTNDGRAVSMKPPFPQVSAASSMPPCQFWKSPPESKEVPIDLMTSRRKLLQFLSARERVKSFKTVKSDRKVQLWTDGPYWAETNIGAENPWDSGDYFWWGDTIGYKYENGVWVASDGSSSGFSFEKNNVPTCGKDNATLLHEGWVTADGVLAPKHDAAHVNWGGEWRMPMDKELTDLCERCDWTWSTVHGVNGYVVRGRGDFVSFIIFLPAAGCGEEVSLNKVGSNGGYWSSVPFSGKNGSRAWGLFFGPGGHGTGDRSRYGGRSVRPVQGFIK